MLGDGRHRGEHAVNPVFLLLDGTLADASVQLLPEAAVRFVVVVDVAGGVGQVGLEVILLAPAVVIEDVSDSNLRAPKAELDFRLLHRDKIPVHAPEDWAVFFLSREVAPALGQPPQPLVLELAHGCAKINGKRPANNRRPPGEHLAVTTDQSIISRVQPQLALIGNLFFGKHAVGDVWVLSQSLLAPFACSLFAYGGVNGVILGVILGVINGVINGVILGVILGVVLFVLRFVAVRVPELPD
mmetsp:Transcript_6849/g.28369  ORF Transcript_6849/g.28369 Transcript_6849/m.28369 type:complete len:243 (-) Transcript_6849:752-1480(-)